MTKTIGSITQADVEVNDNNKQQETTMKETIQVTKQAKHAILDAFKDLTNAEAVVADLLSLKRSEFTATLVWAGVSPERASTISTCKTISKDSANMWFAKLDAMFEVE